MASYTIELGTILRMVHASPEDNWEAGWGTIGLACYPIYDEAHRGALNGRIIRHYFLREIGMETHEMFAYYMDEANAAVVAAPAELVLVEPADGSLRDELAVLPFEVSSGVRFDVCAVGCTGTGEDAVEVRIGEVAVDDAGWQGRGVRCLWEDETGEGDGQCGDQ